MNSITYLTLDLQAPNLAVVASAKQNDTMGRKIAAKLRDGSAAFDATGLLCEIRYAKPDGTVGFYDTMEDDETPAYVISGDTVTFILAEQMLTVAGAVYVDVNFYAPTGEKLTAFAFVLQVEASVLADGTIVSSDYFNVLTATLAEAAAIAADLPVPSTSTPIPDSASGSAGSADGFSRGNHSHPLNVATSGTPANLGTAANGTSDNYARQDHVHDMPSATDVGALPDTTTAADLDVEYKIFDSVTDLGLTSGSATIADAYDAMSDCSMLICDAAEFTTSAGGVLGTLGTVQIIKNSDDCTSILFFGKDVSTGDYRMYCDTSTGEPTGVWVPRQYKTVWTNANPTSAFGTQKVAVDLTPYRFVLIAFLASAFEQYHVTQITMKGAWGRAESLLNMTWNSTVATAGGQRAYNVHTDGSGITFDDCAVRGDIAVANAPSTINNCMIPQYIVGIA